MATKSSRAKRVKKPKPTSAIQNRIEKGVVAGSRRGTSQSSVVPRAAFLTIPSTEGTGTRAAVACPFKNWRGCTPYQQQ